jgi:hypothetical protein
LGWRFQRSVSIFPGVRLNFSRSGISTSVGVKGATVNFGRHGQKTTLGLPGTGLSHSSFSSNETETLQEAGSENNDGQKSHWLGWLIGILAIFGLGHCVSQQNSDPKSAVKAPFVSTPPKTTQTPSVEETITVSHAGGRSTPDRSGPVVIVLKSGDRVRVVKSENGWKQVIKDGITVWILARQMSSTIEPRAKPVETRTQTLPRHTPAVVVRKKQRPASSASRCSCSSRSVCTGPRGGRYCLNANGNKVYGQ